MPEHVEQAQQLEAQLERFKVPAWECAGCGELYHEADEAAACCPPVESRAYECPWCKALYEVRAPNNFRGHLEECEGRPNGVEG